MNKQKYIIPFMSPFIIQENQCIERYQTWLNTGYYPEGQFSKTWDMFAWISNEKAKKENS